MRNRDLITYLYRRKQYEKDYLDFITEHLMMKMEIDKYEKKLLKKIVNRYPEIFNMKAGAANLNFNMEKKVLEVSYYSTSGQYEAELEAYFEVSFDNISELFEKINKITNKKETEETLEKYRVKLEIND